MISDNWADRYFERTKELRRTQLYLIISNFIAIAAVTYTGLSLLIS